MKMIYSMAAVLLLAACTSNSAKLAQLQKDNDSLVIAATQTQSEFDELLATLNEVEDGFAQIKDAENYLFVQSQSNNDINPSTRDRLANDMRLVQETLKNNREQLAQLNELYAKSKNQSAQMKKTIARLNAELEEKTATITSLQNELAKKDVKIAELTESLADLAGTVDELSNETESQKKQLAMQEIALNTGYYVFGTKNELKDEKIISGSGLFESTKVMTGDFNKSYFTKIDIRTLKQIPLYAKKAKMLSKMPADSYNFEKANNGELTLVITDVQKFWSLTKYLVILVD